MKSRTKQQQSTTNSVATTSTTKINSNTITCDSHGRHYPSISAAYWLPASNTTPYLLPGI